MKHLLYVFSLLALLFIGACGSSSGSELSPSVTPEASSNVSADGGKVEIAGIATIEFPSGTFQQTTEVKAEMKTIDDETLTKDFEKSLPPSFLGPTEGRALVVTVPAQPLKEVTIKYNVPTEFLTKLGQDYKAVLFGKFLQYGANDEEFEDFVSLEQSIFSNSISAKLPRTLFTDNRSDGAIQAVMVLGSLKTSTSKAFAPTSSFFLSTTTVTTCKGNPISNPLADELTITSPFGERSHPISGQLRMHYGIDLRANTGDNVFAVADGTVEAIGFDYNSNTGRGYGRYVVILHPDGAWTKYAHLEEGSADQIHVGDSVSARTVIGKADTTGGATAPHLHFEYGAGMSKNSPPIDPYGCIALPIKVVSTSVGEATYWPYFEIPFDIDLDVTEPNCLESVYCDDSGATSIVDYGCHAWGTESDDVSGHINLLSPRGTVSVTVKITDCLGVSQSIILSEAWDCCDSHDTAAYYGGVIRSCIALGDTSKTTLCPVK